MGLHFITLLNCLPKYYVVILLIKSKIILLMEKNNNITRQDLYQIVFNELGLPKNECAKFVDLVFEYLIKELEKKNKVKIALFGSFNLKTKSARVGRNPKTKETAEIIGRNVVRFKPSKMLIKKINKQINE